MQKTETFQQKTESLSNSKYIYGIFQQNEKLMRCLEQYVHDKVSKSMISNTMQHVFKINFQKKVSNTNTLQICIVLDIYLDVVFCWIDG